MVDLNLCAPYSDGNGIRKGIVVEVFLLYLSNLIINGILYRQNPDQDSTGMNKNNDGMPPPNAAQPKPTTTNVSDVNKFFTVFLGYHIVPIGIALLYCPYIYSIVIAYLHLLGYIVVVVAHKLEKEKLVKYGYAFSQLTNLMLIFGGLVQIPTYDSCNI